MPWNLDGDAYHEGLKLDPDGCGAGWARIAVAMRGINLVEARECAGRALASNPAAWRAWFEAFVAGLEADAAA